VIPRGWLAAAVACLAVGALPATARAAVPAWTTYHHDGARSGIDPDSTSPVTPTQAWQTPALDGEIWGQPLVYGSRVYVATENDTVYALDFSTGAVVWHKHLATPVDASQLCGGDIDPTVGITSTPAIDPSTGRIYVVADTEENDDASTIAHEMYALNLSDGSVAVGPVNVDPPGAPSGDTPANQLQRQSLALDAGKIIIGYGGNDSDCGNYHGWLVAAPENGSGPPSAFEVDSQSGDSQGAIWGSGNAPAIDSSGDVWTATGNGNSGSTFDYGDSVLKLGPSMNLLDWWAPSDWQSLDSSDLDLGSSVPLLLPDGLVFEIGKQGIGYLLSQSHLGGEGANPLHSASVCSGSWGGGIYVGGVIYVACSDGMYALKLDTTTKTFAPLAGWSVNSNAVAPPIFAGGLVWSTGSSANSQTGLLSAINPTTGATMFSANLNGFEHFATPSAAGGLLFVANNTSSGGDQVTAYRIAKTPPPSATKMSVASSSNPAAAGERVTLTATVAPTPDAGTVAFTDGGKTIAGCGAVPVSAATVRATCTTSFKTKGSRAIVAKYSGDAYYLAASGSLTQSVTATLPPPSISHLRVRVVRRKLRLSVTLSEPARLTVVVWKLVPGRRLDRRCRPRARHGRRCTATVMKLRFHLNARGGASRFRPRMRALAPGRYLVTVIAIGSDGARSRQHAAVVAVPRR
jgi:polyvinyl alcohol dehydrogenase (cytochrome)